MRVLACVTQLLDLPDDALVFIFGACTTPSLCNLAATCTALQRAVQAAEPWAEALWRDFGVPSSRLYDGSRARDLYMHVASMGPPVELNVASCLTDGGLDGSMLPTDQPEGSCITRTINESARQFWVDSAFGATGDFRAFCSDISPTGGPAANVILAGRITGQLSASLAKAREEEAARREFICTRLARVAQWPLWGWNMDGFGGMHTACTAQLEEALLVAWTTPDARQLLLGGLKPAEFRQLRQIVSSIAPPQPLVVSSLALRDRKQVLVEHRSLIDARLWEADCHYEAIARVLPDERPASASEEALSALEKAQTAREACETQVSAVEQIVRRAVGMWDGTQIEEVVTENASLDDALPWLQKAGGSAASGDALAAHEMERLVLCAPSGPLGVVASLRVRRGVHCSCPVNVGFILGSRGPMTPSDLTSASMLALDDVLEIDQIPASAEEARAAGSLIPHRLHVHELDEATVVEFAREERNEEGVFPIAWFRFHSTLESAAARAARTPAWTESGEFECTLVQKRSTHLLLARLVSAENRMRAMADDHAEPNIDVEHIGVTGHALTAFYPSGALVPPDTMRAGEIYGVSGRAIETE